MESYKGGLPTASGVLEFKIHLLRRERAQGFLLLHISFSVKMGLKA